MLFLECTTSCDEDDENQKQNKPGECHGHLNNNKITKNSKRTDLLIDKEQIMTNSSIIDLCRDDCISNPGMILFSFIYYIRYLFRYLGRYIYDSQIVSNF